MAATCQLASLKPTDLVADPACGTGRFLIRAMADMCEQAGNVTGKSQEEVTRQIKQKLILGCDIDPWIAVIAKMNMYIHGDGKSNIRQANGLTLATAPAFAPQRKKPLAEALDVVVTNPPLGDINFVAVAEGVGKFQAMIAGTSGDAADVARRASEWSSSNLDVVPHIALEEEAEKRAAKKADEWRDKAAIAKISGDVSAEAHARKYVEQWDSKRKEANKSIGAGNITYKPAGNTAKGGALFLSAIGRCLKRVRDASLPVEWRGGVLGLIIDEAVLNTREYATARAFIRQQYFLKAIVSLPRDAFEDLAKTTAKTSIMILIRKDDPSVLQREPIFFARADQTGASGNDLKKPNDLIAICQAFDLWRTTAFAHCAKSGQPVPTKTEVGKAQLKLAAASLGVGQVALRYLDVNQQSQRLDEAFWCMQDLVSKIPTPVPLSDVADLISEGRIPPEQDIYAFASVARNEGRVRFKGETTTQYSTDNLQQVKTGDILVSGIDLVHGAVGVVGQDCDGMIVSKEYFILAAKNGNDPHWLVSLLRTGAMRRIVEGTITGTSNRTRVESPEVLMALPLPQPPNAKLQKMVGDALRSAHKHHQQMVQSIQKAEVDAAKIADLPFGLVKAEDEEQSEDSEAAE